MNVAKTPDALRGKTRPLPDGLIFDHYFYAAGRMEYGQATLQHLPVAVIGGGPVGLAAAAHLIARGLPVKVYEAGPAVGSNLRDWGHVRVFTPWRYCVDAGCDRAPQSSGWSIAAIPTIARQEPN